MALYNEAWFIHGVNSAVEQASQQTRALTTGATQIKTGVVGKTAAFNVLDSVEMTAATTRDGDTVYLNPNQTKRRAILTDWHAAILIDEFDELKTLTNPQSEFIQALVAARNRKIDDFVLSAFGAALTGGAMGLATVVNESGESTSTSALPTGTIYFRGQQVGTAGQVIANGGTGLTLAKVRGAGYLMNAQAVDVQDRFMFYSPRGAEQLLRDPQVTSADFASVKRLEAGGFGEDETWMGFKWRESTQLPLVSGTTIRGCVAIQKRGVGVAMGLVKEVRVSDAPHKWNNTQCVVKLSGGAVRILDPHVVEIDIDESV